jgi:hypothetical protein
MDSRSLVGVRTQPKHGRCPKYVSSEQSDVTPDSSILTGVSFVLFCSAIATRPSIGPEVTAALPRVLSSRDAIPRENRKENGGVWY